MGNIFTKNGSTRFCDEFVEIVQLILDNEASEADKQKFNDYYMKCTTCTSYYNLESSTIELLKNHIQQNKLAVPEDLASEIRSKIKYSVQ